MVSLSIKEWATFADTICIYSIREKVSVYNHNHMTALNILAIYIEATNQGEGIDKADLKDVGNLFKNFPAYVGARVMLTYNLWNAVGLVNGV